jgi:ectoine hydroxylase-related dioxygenase (phytanoyl-CoA dioxygenase family)
MESHTPTFALSDVQSQKQLAAALDSFNTKGFIVLNLNPLDGVIEGVVDDMTKFNIEELKLNPKVFHYNESPRIIEFWRKSSNCKQLALNKFVLHVGSVLFGRQPLPFSTINFFRSTEQPLHSDAIHFGSSPPGLLFGAWVALEDIDPAAGPLCVVPGSHLWPEVNLDHLGLPIPTSSSILKSNYTVYEDFVASEVRKLGAEIVPLCIPKGHCIIWDSNLLHGANMRANKDATRLSQVTHYHLEGGKYHNPLYSKPSIGKIAYRNLTNSIIT